jgi:hypothetical protein
VRSREQRIPLLRSESMNPRAAIHASEGMKEAMDLAGQFAIFSGVRAGLAGSPVIAAASTDFQDPTHGAHGILPGILGRKRITQGWLREKMAKAFFKTSRSAA